MIENIILVYAVIIFLFAGVFLIPGLLARKDAFEVIKIFYRYNALNAKNAKKASELGLNPPSFFESMGRRRDYKPYVLQKLEKADVIRRTDDGRLYMAEEKLAENVKYNRQLKKK